VHRSADVLAFVRTLLKQAGYGVLTADNLADALVLLQGGAPRAVLIDSGLRGLRTTASAVRFNSLVASLPTIELRPEFATGDPGAAGERLLADVAGLVGFRSAAPS
jgi:hypothetical protein